MTGTKRYLIIGLGVVSTDVFDWCLTLCCVCNLTA